MKMNTFARRGQIVRCAFSRSGVTVDYDFVPPVEVNAGDTLAIQIDAEGQPHILVSHISDRPESRIRRFVDTVRRMLRG